MKVRDIFRFRAASECGLGDRWHAFADCHQITGNRCIPISVGANDAERALCWTCVGRLTRETIAS
jgi:hypothetical protein